MTLKWPYVSFKVIVFALLLRSQSQMTSYCRCSIPLFKNMDLVHTARQFCDEFHNTSLPGSQVSYCIGSSDYVTAKYTFDILVIDFMGDKIHVTPYQVFCLKPWTVMSVFNSHARYIATKCILCIPCSFKTTSQTQTSNLNFNYCFKNEGGNFIRNCPSTMLLYCRLYPAQSMVWCIA